MSSDIRSFGGAPRSLSMLLHPLRAFAGTASWSHVMFMNADIHFPFLRLHDCMQER